RHLEENSTMSITEAQLRAITSLPMMDQVRGTEEYVFVPIYKDQKDIIDELILIYPSWKFTFYPVVKNDLTNKNEAIGHIIIYTNDMKKTMATLIEKGL